MFCFQMKSSNYYMLLLIVVCWFVKSTGFIVNSEAFLNYYTKTDFGRSISFKIQNAFTVIVIKYIW